MVVHLIDDVQCDVLAQQLSDHFELVLCEQLELHGHLAVIVLGLLFLKNVGKFRLLALHRANGFLKMTSWLISDLYLLYVE